MAAKGTEKVKNVVLVGQGGVGKTMLAEAMLHLTGRTTRLGGHAGTKPTLDYDGEEGERGFSISTAIAPVEWEGTRINVLDAPCYPDFVGDAYAAMSACETGQRPGHHHHAPVVRRREPLAVSRAVHQPRGPRRRRL